MRVDVEVLIATDHGLYDLAAPTAPVAFAGRRVDHAVSDWAVVEGVLHQRPGGHWLPVAGPNRTDTDGLAVTCVTPLPDGALAGTAGAHLLRVTDADAQLIDAFDDAPTRSEWYTPWGGPPDVRSLVVANDGAWLVNVHVGGILRSTDGGASWAATIDLDTDVHQVIWQAGVALAALGVSGLAESRDGGVTWQQTTKGLHAAYCRAVTVAGDTLLLSASSGPGGAESAIYRRPLASTDVALEPCVDGLPPRFDANIDTHCLAARSDTVVFGTRSGDVYGSADAGLTWERLAEGLPPVRGIHLAPSQAGGA